MRSRRNARADNNAWIMFEIDARFQRVRMFPWERRSGDQIAKPPRPACATNQPRNQAKRTSLGTDPLEKMDETQRFLARSTHELEQDRHRRAHSLWEPLDKKTKEYQNKERS